MHDKKQVKATSYDGKPINTHQTKEEKKDPLGGHQRWAKALPMSCETHEA